MKQAVREKFARASAAALTAAMICTTAGCATSAVNAVTSDMVQTDQTSSESTTEETSAAPVTTEAETDAELDLETKEVKVVPFQLEETPDWNADYNQPKISADNLVEGMTCNSVLIGREDWFFYTPTIADFIGSNLYSDSTLASAAKVLQARADWCERNGMEMYVLVAPNKSTIYPDKMASGYTHCSESRLAQFYKYMEKNTDLNIIDVRTELKQARETHPDIRYYYKYDTHWNWNSGFVAYTKIMQTIQQKFPAARCYPYSDYRVDVEPAYQKDLAYFIGWYDTKQDDGWMYTKTDGRTATLIDSDSPNTSDGTSQHAYIREDGYRDSCHYTYWKNDYASDAPSAFVIRDSFSIALVPFLRDSFSEATFIWTRDFSRSAILDAKPDVVIYELVERDLDSLFSGGPFTD